jgi:hypothetical protein
MIVFKSSVAEILIIVLFLKIMFIIDDYHLLGDDTVWLL